MTAPESEAVIKPIHYLFKDFGYCLINLYIEMI